MREIEIMKRILLGSLLCLSTCALLSAEPISVTLYAKGTKANPVVVTFQAQAFSGDAGLNTDAGKTIQNIVTTYSKDSLDAVLKLWDVDDREAIRKVASDKKMFEGNQSYYRKFTKTRLHMTIFYGDYQIAVVEHFVGESSSFKDYPLKPTADGWKLTNSLTSDPVYSYITTSYVRSLKSAALGTSTQRK